MFKNPFKFLDSYTKADKDIFFGREKETEEIFSRLYYSKMLLIYGPSGSGKTSLLQCGVANRFGEHDWKPIFIRRKQNIIHSLNVELGKQAITSLKEKQPINSKLYSLYLDYLTPIYLIFDQFEELFIFSTIDEKQEFVNEIKNILSSSDGNTHIILSIREEYLANLTAFEDDIPELFENRIRIEKMKKPQALAAIEEPCKVGEVTLEEGVSEKVLERLSTKSGFIELTWLQVIMDSLYKKALERNPQQITIINEDIDQLGKMGDVLGNFLDEQLKAMEEGEKGEAILKAMISSDGTKRQLTLEELNSSLQSLGNQFTKENILKLLQRLINVRIISDKDENGRYELKHDSLAAKIYEKLTLAEKELLEVRQFIENAYQHYLNRKVLLRQEDLNYIFPYQSKLILKTELLNFIKVSKKEIEKAKKRKRNFWIAGALVFIFIMVGFTIWALNERNKAVKQKALASEQKRKAVDQKSLAEQQKFLAEEQKEKAVQANLIAEMAKDTAIRAREIVEKELYDNIQNSLSISPLGWNILFFGIDNPVNIAASGISVEKLRPYSYGRVYDKIADSTFLIENASTIIKSKDKLIVKNIKPNVFELLIGAFGITSKGDTINLGTKSFRVKKIPDPTVLLNGKGGGNISKTEILSEKGLEVTSPFLWYSPIEYDIKDFKMDIPKEGGYYQTEKSDNKFFTDEMKQNLPLVPEGGMIIIKDIVVKGPLGLINLPEMAFIIGGDIVEEQMEKKARIDALLLDAFRLLEDNPYLSYRLAEAAYIIDKQDSSTRSALIKTFAYAFSLSDLIKEQKDFDNIWLSPNENNLIITKNSYDKKELLDNPITYYNIKKDKIEQIWANYSISVGSLIFSENGSSFLTCSGRDKICHIDISGRLLSSFKTGKYNSGLFSFQNNETFISRRFTYFYLWNINGGKLANFAIKRSWSLTYHVTTNKDGTKYASAHKDGFINLWDNKGKLLNQINSNNQKPVFFVTFSPDESKLLSSEGNNVLLRDLHGKLLNEFRGHKKRVLTAFFSSDGQKIITTGADFIIQIWDISGNKEMTLKINPVVDIYNRPKAYFSKDMKYIYYVSGSNAKKIPLDPEEIIDIVNNVKFYGEIPQLTDEYKQRYNLDE